MFVFIKCLTLLLLTGIIGQIINGECPDIQNCMDCVNTDVKCQECEETKVLSQDGTTCENCQTGCKTCSRNGDGTLRCSTCFDGYSLASDGSACVDCGTNCLECDTIGNCNKCEENFVYEDNICKSCPSDCQKCTDSTTCSICKSGFYLTTVDQMPNSCVACEDNCAVCASETCTECAMGYLVKDEDCVACPWKCTDCISDAEAEAGDRQINPNIADKTKICNQNGCEEGYGYKAHDSCDPCPEHCTSCNRTDCKSCEDGYTISLNGDDGTYRCTVCPPNCKDCLYDPVVGTVRCSTCEDLHALNPTTGQCEACDENCLGNCRWETIYSYGPGSYGAPNDVVADGPVCGVCKVRFGVTTGGLCKACPDNCLGCFDINTNPDADTMVCDFYCDVHYECGDNLLCQYYRHPDRDDPIDVPNKYDFTNLIIKAVPIQITGELRKKRQTLLLDVGDSPYSPNGILSCCEYGYRVDDEGLCTSCGDGCLWCDANYCEQCFLGLDLDGNQDCTVQCPENCHDCTSSGDCSVCEAIARIDEVENTHYVEIVTDGITDTCYKCPRNCEASQQSFLEDNPTLKHCEFSTDLGKPVCKSNEYCRPGTGLTPDKQCKECGTLNCKKCQWILNNNGLLESSCLTCNDLFVKDDQRDCRDCPEHCLECSYNSGEQRTECKEGHCEEGFVRNPDDGTCITCGTGCTACNVLGNGKINCNMCSTKYVLHPMEGYCVACPEHCSVCEYDGNNQLKCSGSDYCAPGYSLGVDNNCHPCPRNCEKCHGHESGVMYAEYCYPYFYRNQEQCGACPDGCSTCTDDEGTMQCADCDEGLVLSMRSKTCIKCPSNCKTCKEVDEVGICEQCKENFHLIDGQCVSCSELHFENCAECTPIDGECTACSDGYALSTDKKSCSSCTQSISGCSVCLDLQAECTTCDNGLEPLLNGQCGFYCYACDEDDANCLYPSLNSTKAVQCASYENSCAIRSRSVGGNVTYSRMCAKTSECEPKCQNTGDIETCHTCCNDAYCNDNDFSSNTNILQAAVALVWSLVILIISY